MLNRSQYQKKRKYYVRINVQQHYNGTTRVPGSYYTNNFVKYIWPKLFDTYPEAFNYAMANNPMKNSDTTGDRGRIIGWCIESVRVKKYV